MVIFSFFTRSRFVLFSVLSLATWVSSSCVATTSAGLDMGITCSDAVQKWGDADSYENIALLFTLRYDGLERYRRNLSKFSYDPNDISEVGSKKMFFLFGDNWQYYKAQISKWQESRRQNYEEYFDDRLNEDELDAICQSLGLALSMDATRTEKLKEVCEYIWGEWEKNSQLEAVLHTCAGLMVEKEKDTEEFKIVPVYEFMEKLIECSIKDHNDLFIKKIMPLNKIDLSKKYLISDCFKSALLHDNGLPILRLLVDNKFNSNCTLSVFTRENENADGYEVEFTPLTYALHQLVEKANLSHHTNKVNPHAYTEIVNYLLESARVDVNQTLSESGLTALGYLTSKYFDYTYISHDSLLYQKEHFFIDLANSLLEKGACCEFTFKHKDYNEGKSCKLYDAWKFIRNSHMKRAEDLGIEKDELISVKERCLSLEKNLEQHHNFPQKIEAIRESKLVKGTNMPENVIQVMGGYVLCRVCAAKK